MWQASFTSSARFLHGIHARLQRAAIGGMVLGSGVAHPEQGVQAYAVRLTIAMGTSRLGEMTKEEIDINQTPMCLGATY
jgi:hypothetical protein